MPRPRKSLEDHVRDGTYRADRHGPLPAGFLTARGPVPSPAVQPADAELTVQPPRKPEDMAEDVAAEWDRLALLLAGVVRDRDADAVSQMAWWLVELGRVQAVIGRMIPGHKGYKDALIAAGICQDKFDKLATKFGMTPADRAKLRSEAGPPKAKVPTRPRTKLDAAGPPKP